jgi:uncharacterized phage protein (TIGR01671 family)
MRDIKFRAWDKNEEAMVDAFTLWDLLEEFRYAEGEAIRENNKTVEFLGKPSRGLSSFFYGENDHMHLMQYTGLKDKNGVEIYEGDIVKMHYFYQSLGANMGVVESEEEIVGEVFHDEFGWAITNIQGRHWEELTAYEPGEGKSYIAHLYNMDGQTHEESFEVIGNVYENAELLEAPSQNASASS